MFFSLIIAIQRSFLGVLGPKSEKKSKILVLAPKWHNLGLKLAK